jgi:site-specific DNA-methyltransferase (adenine-specific)
VVLDPFCGCGTAVVAAENWQKWIGIDITYYAIGVGEKTAKRPVPCLAFGETGIPRSWKTRVS